MGYAPLGKNISLATPIAIRFSEPMDELSVKSAFTVHPIANHGTDFLDNDTLFLATPYSPMYAAALYTVELTTAATDRAGNHLPENLTFNFTTEPDTSGPVVVETRPTGHNISRNDYIEVRFNEWVNESSYIDGFSVEPHMEGEFLSSNGRKTFSFYPTDPLDFGTSYRVTLHGSIEDFTGNTMGEDYTFNFTTVPAPDISTPEITAFGPVGENRSIHSKLFLEFSESMSTMVFAALSITPDIIFEYNHSKNQTYFEFRPVRPLAGATTFSVTVSPDASDLAGNSMARLFNFNFTTHETRSPRVIGSSPIHNELDVALDARITFRFDERVFSGPDFMINFVPQTNFSWNIENENNSLVIHPTLSLIEDVGYSVTVKGLADAFDNVITPTTLRFSTMRTEKDDDREFLEVYQYYPDVLRNVPVNTPVYVTFHESLDVESIGDDTFRLLENNETRIVGSTRYDGDTTLSFDPARGLKPNTTYTARVSGVLSARGGRGLERPLYFTFTTRPPEYTLTVVLDFRPENGSTIDYRKENVTIWILFSSPMQLDSLGKNLVFLPEVNFTLVPEANYRLFRVHLAEDLLPSTGYEVTIGGLSTDENGTIMGETVSFQFSTKVGGEKARKEDRSWIRDNIFYLTVGIIVMMVLGVLFLRPGKIKSLPGEIPCPECDRPILRDDRKCWNCGKSLMEDAEEEKEEEDDDEVEGEEEEDEEDEDAGEEEDPEDEEGKGDDEVEEGEGDEEGKGDDKVGEGEGAEEGKGDDEVEEDEGDEDGVEGTGENGTHKEGEDEKGDDRGEDGVEEDGDDGTDEGQGDEG